jgi:magnesium-transporting ATPase (P-type)
MQVTSDSQMLQEKPSPGPSGRVSRPNFDLGNSNLTLGLEGLSRKSSDQNIDGGYWSSELGMEFCPFKPTDEEEQIIDLLKAINLCHSARLVKYGQKEDFVTDFPEEKAAIDFCRQIGFVIESHIEASDCNKYLHSIVIRDSNINREYAFDILAQNVIKSHESDDYVVSVLATQDEYHEQSVLYVRGPFEVMTQKLALADQRSDYFRKYLKLHKEQVGYKYMYAKKVLNSQETYQAKTDLQCLDRQLVIDTDLYRNVIEALESD